MVYQSVSYNSRSTQRLQSQTAFSSAFGLMAIINELPYRVNYGTDIPHMHSTYELFCVVQQFINVAMT